MRNRMQAILLAGGTALALCLTAAPSFATTATWTVSPGGAIAGHGGTTKLSDTSGGFTVTCPSSDFAGTLKKGSGLSGTQVGTITSFTFKSCTSVGNTVQLTAGLPWTINFTSQSQGVVHGNFGDVTIKLSTASCSATVSGTSAGAANGTVDFTWTLSTGKLKLLGTGGNLHFYDVTGCLGLISNGDPASLTATYTVTPKQNITSP